MWYDNEFRHKHNPHTSQILLQTEEYKKKNEKKTK